MTVFRDVATAIATAVHAELVRQVAMTKAESIDPTAEQRAETFLASLDLAALVALREDFADVLIDAALSGASAGMTTVRLLVPEAEDFPIPSDVVRRWAQAHAADLVGKRVLEDGSVIDNPNAAYAIDEATRDLLRGTIRAAFEPDAEGEYASFADLRTQIADTYAFSEERAATVARNEVGRALVEGNLAAWRESGVVAGLQWILADTHPEPDECDANEGAEVRVGEPFPSGDFAPPIHVNCLCDVLPVVGGEE